MAGKGQPKTGGRKKGTPNKKTMEVLERLNELGSDPLKGLAEFAAGYTDCKTCNKAGKVSTDQYFLIVRIAMPENVKQMTIAARAVPKHKCPYCGGTKKRPVDDNIVLKARAELMQYIAPKRKAVDVNHSADLTWEEIMELLQ